ncbi:glycosyltransferase [Aquimarina brevivitae]|uniref:Glycosyltransferase involved in cell wall biosynthesis n=1 Tax=Aquimarina brevivitae TaxID=323412 RepID=A0A4V2F580_9FLAO|nr:glycosyltransferase [Aquimarina brevivitae]RZS91889.1 glycosyltransferase involved in cell wall biosynthesis [Aquimarina brevivitae]
MKEHKKVSVAIIVASLGIGGAERSSAILSEMLVDHGYSVTIISEFDTVAYSYKGELLFLKGKTKWYWNKITRLFRLRKLIKAGDYNYIIETRSRKSSLKQVFMNTLVFNGARTIFMIHNYNFRLYFPKYKWLTRFLYQNAYQLVGVSKAIVEKFSTTYGLDNCQCIYNAHDLAQYERLSNAVDNIPDVPYIISYGRIVDESKDYSFLLQSYAKSDLKALGVSLLIVGDGPDKERLKQNVKELELENWILFKPFAANPFALVKHALFTTLTSNYEGFPMVLVESMAVGTPIVSVDCNSGPAELIQTGRNGILVKNKTHQEFASAMNKMILDKDFYYTCKEGTKQSIKIFSKERIIEYWKNILVRY